MTTINFEFENLDELNAWLDHVCTRCAMCNRDCGHGDPCSVCRANKIYESKKEDLEGKD